MNKEKAIEKIQEKINKINYDSFINIDSPAFLAWERDTKVLLKSLFGKESEEMKEFDRINFYPLVMDVYSNNADKVERECLKQGLVKAKVLLESLSRQIEEYWDDTELNNKITAESASVLKSTNNIFLAYSYKKEDDDLVAGLKDFLSHQGYSIKDGKADRLGSISEAIISKIKESTLVVIIMTKRDLKQNGLFTTASWLLEEKGAALALGKEVAIFVEEDIDESDIGGMQGDKQRFHFNRNNYLSKVMEFYKCLIK